MYMDLKQQNADLQKQYDKLCKNNAVLGENYMTLKASKEKLDKDYQGLYDDVAEMRKGPNLGDDDEDTWILGKCPQIKNFQYYSIGEKCYNHI